MGHPEALQQVLSLFPPELADQLGQQSTEVLVAGAVGLISLVLLLLYLLVGSKKRSGSVVLVAGPSNSGKTTLFYQLKDGSTHNGTVASMQENSGTVEVKSDKGRVIGHVLLMDVPGHERLRHKLEQHLKEAAAVVFVVDAADITPSKVEAAEELFEVLTHPSIARKRIPVLLACNKMDLDTQAHSMEFVRRTIERQLDSMRKTRTTLSSEAAAKAAVLGKPDKPFSLATLRNPISTASMSASTGDVAEVHAFLAAHAR